MPIPTILLIAAAGAALGATVLSLFVVLYYALLARDAFADGQFMLVFVLTIPFGGMIGAVAAEATAFVQASRAVTAGWICLVGGCRHWRIGDTGRLGFGKLSGGQTCRLSCLSYRTLGRCASSLGDPAHRWGNPASKATVAQGYTARHDYALHRTRMQPVTL